MVKKLTTQKRRERKANLGEKQKETLAVPKKWVRLPNIKSGI
jgi:hypothetical protein